MTFDTTVTNATFAIGNFTTSDQMLWKVYDAQGVLLDQGTITQFFYDANGNRVDISSSSSPNYSIDLSANGLNPGTQFTSMSLESTHDSYKFTGFSVEKTVTIRITISAWLQLIMMAINRRQVPLPLP